MNVGPIEPAPKKRGRPLAPCGTPAAWQRHWRKGEPPCELCAEVHKPRPKRTGRVPSRPCGTYSAAVRHRRHGEEPCAACKAAEKEYTRQLYVKKRSQDYVRPYRKHNMKASQPLTWAHIAAMVRAREDLPVRLGLAPELCAALVAEAKRLGYL